jgi:hypothetical protein
VTAEGEGWSEAIRGALVSLRWPRGGVRAVRDGLVKGGAGGAGKEMGGDRGGGGGDSALLKGRGGEAAEGGAARVPRSVGRVWGADRPRPSRGAHGRTTLSKLGCAIL